ncbi:MAG: GFA family protein [Planctomycetota bacterium]
MREGIVRGACYCGQVRFEVELPPHFVSHCHNCRRAHGAGFVTWAGFEGTQFRILEGEADLERYKTETEATRSFCRICGSTLLFESPRWAGEVHVAVANLVDELDEMPSGHAYADRSPDWCPITDDLTRYGGESGTERLDERRD